MIRFDDFLAYIRAWARSVFGRSTKPVAEPLAERPTRAKRPTVSTMNDGGEFYFRDAILDQLDQYFKVMRRMRRGDREAYDYFSRIGANLIPMWIAGSDSDPMALSKYWLDTLPSPGGVMIYHPLMRAKDGGRPQYYPRAIYFKRYKPNQSPPEVQRVNDGAIYVVTFYWDEPELGFKPAPCEVPFALSSDGEVSILRTRLQERQVVRSRHGQSFTVPASRWGVHEYLRTWAAEHNAQPSDFFRNLFLYMATLHESAALGASTRVVVRQAGVACVFGVNILRTPYFFADRDVRVGERRRPIFHIVRSHERKLDAARSTTIKTHFRGERAFTWNGYEVKISVPGWHHFDLADLNMELVSLEENLPIPRGMIGAKGIADLIGKAVDQERGGFHRARKSKARKLRRAA